MVVGRGLMLLAWGCRAEALLAELSTAINNHQPDGGSSQAMEAASYPLVLTARGAAKAASEGRWSEAGVWRRRAVEVFAPLEEQVGRGSGNLPAFSSRTGLQPPACLAA